MSFLSQLPDYCDPKRLRDRISACILDLLAFAVSFLLAFELRFDGVLPAKLIHVLLLGICVLPGIKLACFLLCSVNRGYWQYTSIGELVRLVWANTVGSAMGAITIWFVFGATTAPRSIFILEWLISCCLTFGGRIAVWVLATNRRSGISATRARKNALIYGAGSAGLALAKELQQNGLLGWNPIGFVDDDIRKVGLTFQGKKVVGSGESLADLAQRRAVDVVLIAIPSASGPEMVRILRLITDAGVNYKMVPGLAEIIQGADLGKQIKDVAVEDLLGRQPVELNEELIEHRIQGKIVMVTGAAGSIGSEICRQIARFRPAAIVGLDEAETPLFQVDRELSAKFPRVPFYAEIGNIRRPEDLRRVILRHHPSILYHAAAYKHVPMMERHVFAAVENNVFGTWNVALAAVTYGINDFVMISSDKAVRPTSMMGATKRLAELLIRALQTQGPTRFVSVRFGNVLGSNGSVVPIFKEQISAGGPVTVTHPDIRRYFMTMPEAAQLVLQSFAIGKGGEVFVLDMGDPVRIVDLATNLIMLSGLQPEKDVKIEFTGLRPGEKLFEELNLEDEFLVPTSHPKICSYLGPTQLDLEGIKFYLQELRRILDRQDVPSLVLLVKELIPDYNPGSQILKIAMSAKPDAPELPVLTHKLERSPLALTPRPTG